MRHAKAVREPGLSDHARWLTQRGRDDAVRVARFLQDNRHRPDLAIASDARRTRETLELASGVFNPAPAARLDASLYLAEPYAILKAIRATPASVSKLLVVGHNPGIADLALALMGRAQGADAERLALSFPTSAVAIIEFDCDWFAVEELAGRLERLVIAKSLREEQD
ncbi:MAG: histidine phosphatase family protein [Beijerinckiaceae bacterium]|nr:histidine phosphatase family protein [Beijerinckiaceae bacterium]